MRPSSRRYEIALGAPETCAFVAARREREFEAVAARIVKARAKAVAKPSLFIRLFRAAGAAAAPCLVVAFALWFAREHGFELFEGVPLVGAYLTDEWIGRIAVASVAIGAWVAGP